MNGDPRLLSRPLRVHWAGWETNTFRLQKAGWKLSAMQDIRGSRLQLAFQHSGRRCEAISQVIDYKFEQALDMRNREYVENVVLQVDGMMADPLHVSISGSVNMAWGPIDCEPRYTEERIVRLEDLVHFAGPLIRTQEIIVPEESIPQLLEKILKLQQPARMARIREELRGEHRLEQKFHAQIISLRDVA